MGCSSSIQVDCFHFLRPPPKEQVEVACFHANYRLGPKLGKGAFAQVRIATEVSSGKQWAVKILELYKNDDSSQLDQRRVRTAKNEVVIQKRLGTHSNVVGLHYAVMDKGLFYMVMEECSQSLWSLLDGKPRLVESDIMRNLKQMLIAIAHVHSVGVVHRDIKPDNFLSTSDGSTLKLCDFGLSKVLPPKALLTGMYGTAPYMSPEMVHGMGYDGRTDVWSCGVIAYVFFFGQFPYVPTVASSTEMKEAIRSGHPTPNFRVNATLVGNQDGPSKAGTDFVSSLINRIWKRRPNASQALCSELFESNSQTRASGNQPSFRSMLYAAKKVGAFEKRNLSDDGPVDNLLNDLQLQHQGLPLQKGKTVGYRKVRPLEKHLGNEVGSSRLGDSDSASGSTAPESTTCSELSWSRCSTPYLHSFDSASREGARSEDLRLVECRRSDVLGHRAST